MSYGSSFGRSLAGRGGRGSGGATRAKVINRNVDLVTGLITTVSTYGLLAATFSKTSGSSNLTINGATGAVSATAALTEGQTQSLVGKVTGSDGVVLPFTLNATGHATPTPTPTPSQTILLIGGHGDSRLGEVYGDTDGVVPPTIAAGKAYQWVEASEVSAGYPLTAGLTEVMCPLANPVNPQAGGTGVVPVNYAIAEMLDPASPYYVGANTIIVYAGGGYNSQAVAKTGHQLGPLPDATTTYNKAKWAAAYAACQAQWPDATIKPIGLMVACTNDRGAVDPAVLQTAVEGVLNGPNSLRTATGWSAAPWVVVSICPEGTPGLIDTAQRVAAMHTAGAIWCQLPPGVGLVHEGEVSGQAVQIGIEAAGRNNYAKSLAIAAGAIAAPNTVISTPTTVHVTEGSTTEIPFQANTKIYGTVTSGFGSVIELSGDVEQDAQAIRPAGGTWGSPGNVSISVDWKDANGKTGTFAATVVVDAAVSVTYLAADNFNRADAAQSAGLGTTSGISGSGGGLTWNGIGGITSGKADLTGATANPISIVDVGTPYVEIECDVTLGSVRPAQLILASHLSNGHRIWASLVAGSVVSVFQVGPGGFQVEATGTDALPAGTHHFKFHLSHEAPYYMVRVWCDGVLFCEGSLQTWAPDDATETYAGIAIDQGETGILFDNFTVIAT